MEEHASGAKHKLFISMPFAALAQAIVGALVVWALLAAIFDEAWKISGLIGLLIGLGLWRFSWRQLSVDERYVRFTTAFSKDDFPISDIAKVGLSLISTPFPRQVIFLHSRDASGSRGFSISIGVLDRRRARRWIEELNKRLGGQATP